ncbi:phosphonate C-P lyase system protein PhnH [Cognatishimia sp. SS12]|uniref:phosphonate C-P lyase system protein PhnH n=1 Tax=Cognatishimia sp. SS12 TaxID=2979465 RepID=UPI00232F331F|nr:phosphonate C-P lyase system protein PhnH [Cognatishimia sp. SS12]MDC0738689.1 phosphonate C-P lyase system protein PhnH [Cognatishimia sp. SS12]
MQSAALKGGFETPAVQSAVAFREIMTAMARPGHVSHVTGGEAPAPVSAAAAAVILTLCDADTGLYLAGAYDTEAMRAWVRFHTSAPLCGPEACSFALGTWDDLRPLGRFPLGSAAYPDRSATLIVEVAHLQPQGRTLTGPGIQDRAELSLPAGPEFADNHALFPRGLDFIFTCGAQLAALPRSTRVL